MRNAIHTRLLRSLLAAAALLALAVPAAQAAPGNSAPASVPAATTTTSTSPKTTTVTPTKDWVRLSGLFKLDGHEVTVPGRNVHVVSEVFPYVANQRVTVKVAVGGHVIRQYTTLVKHGPNDSYGWIAATVAPKKIGHVAVSVIHKGDSAQTGYAVHSYYNVLSEKSHPGSKGRFVKLMQQRMLARHIYIHVTGKFDAQTGWALDAYHRLVGLGTARTFGKKVVNDLLDGKGTFNVRFKGQGRHAEGNLTKQLLALVNGKKVTWIYPISSGKESTPTVIGSWQIYRRSPGYLPDGMYYSDFFYSGYAIHGYDPAPDYPASHGCMRLWINDAIQVYDWLGMGDWVDTYGHPPFYLGEGDL